MGTKISEIKDGVQISAGPKHSLCATLSGHLYAWGCNANGRLGLGHKKDMHVPTRVDHLFDKSVTYTACGESHSGCLDSQGVCYTWGAGSMGRLGCGELLDCWVPRRLESIRDLHIIQLQMGCFHSIALTAKGYLYSWGSGVAIGIPLE